MSKCPGLHCGGCGNGGPTAGAVIALIVLAVAAAAHRAIEHAAIDVLHFIEIALIVLGVLGVTASVVAMTVLTVRIRQRRAPATLPAPVTAQAIVVPRARAIEARQATIPNPAHAQDVSPARTGRTTP
jgi:biopolymer transport protein ExbD